MMTHTPYETSCSFPRQRSSHHLACSRCQHFAVGETVFYCENRHSEFPGMCVEYAPNQTEQPGSLMRWIWNGVRTA